MQPHFQLYKISISFSFLDKMASKYSLVNTSKCEPQTYQNKKKPQCVYIDGPWRHWELQGQCYMPFISSILLVYSHLCQNFSPVLLSSNFPINYIYVSSEARDLLVQKMGQKLAKFSNKKNGLELLYLRLQEIEGQGH